jgi:hypothetical protein
MLARRAIADGSTMLTLTTRSEFPNEYERRMFEAPATRVG